MQPTKQAAESPATYGPKSVCDPHSIGRRKTQINPAAAAADAMTPTNTHPCSRIAMRTPERLPASGVIRARSRRQLRRRFGVHEVEADCINSRDDYALSRPSRHSLRIDQVVDLP